MADAKTRSDAYLWVVGNVLKGVCCQIDFERLGSFVSENGVEVYGAGL
jgi:hypothetical protein